MRFIYSKVFILFTVFLVIILIITFLQVKGFGSIVSNVFVNAPRPVTYVARGVTKPVKSFFSTIYNLKKINVENASLTNQVYKLEQQLADYNQVIRENNILKKELGFVANSKIKYVPCNVLTIDPLGLTSTIVINCGENQGVNTGLGVISQGYLIGKVVYTSKNSSTVMLITSSEFSTDARISKSGESGVVKGSFGSGITVDQLSQNDSLENGDMIVTGGINNKIPKDILIGQVSNIASSPNDLFKKATILSPINFSNLEFVFVIEQ